MKDLFTLSSKVDDPSGIFVVQKAILEDGLSLIETVFTWLKFIGLKHLLNSCNVSGLFDDFFVVDQPSLLIVKRVSKLIARRVLEEAFERFLEAFGSFLGQSSLGTEDRLELRRGFGHPKFRELLINNYESLSMIRVLFW